MNKFYEAANIIAVFFILPVLIFLANQARNNYKSAEPMAIEERMPVEQLPEVVGVPMQPTAQPIMQPRVVQPHVGVQLSVRPDAGPMIPTVQPERRPMMRQPIRQSMRQPIRRPYNGASCDCPGGVCPIDGR